MLIFSRIRSLTRASNEMRWRNVVFRWRPLLLILVFIYAIIFLPSWFSISTIDDRNQESPWKPQISNKTRLKFPGKGELTIDHSKELQKIKPEPPEDLKSANFSDPDSKKETSERFVYRLKYRGQDLDIEEVLTHPSMPRLKERVTIPDELTKAKKTKILIWDAGFGQQNLGGCPDWNCEVVTGQSNLAQADVVVMQSPNFGLKKEPHQLFVYYSQESPRNSPSLGHGPSGYFNAMFGFRHDTAGASPYGKS